MSLRWGEDGLELGEVVDGLGEEILEDLLFNVHGIKHLGGGVGALGMVTGDIHVNGTALDIIDIVVCWVDLLLDLQHLHPHLQVSKVVLLSMKDLVHLKVPRERRGACGCGDGRR